MIEEFVGYGDIEAPIIFIGMEEGGSCDLDQMSKRSKFQQLEEISISKPNHRIVRSWRPMCDFMLKLMKLDSNSESRRFYQNNFLAKKGSNVALTELMPYPRVNMKKWPDLYKFRYQDYKSYFEDQLPKRKIIIKDYILKSHRSLIICYGKSYWDIYNSLMTGIIGPYELKSTNYTQFRKGTSDLGTRVVFCPHFSGHFFNSQESMDKLFEVSDGEILRSELLSRMERQKQEAKHPDSPHSAHSPE